MYSRQPIITPVLHSFDKLVPIGPISDHFLVQPLDDNIYSYLRHIVCVAYIIPSHLQQWKMFKARKLQTNRQAKISNSTHRSVFKQAQKSVMVNQYSIIAKSLIHQLSQEVELAVLKKGSFETKVTEILNFTKKCDHETKNIVSAKLFNLYRLQRIKLTQNLYERVLEFINYLLQLIDKNQKKFRDLILMEQISSSLVFIFKCYPNNKSTLLIKFRPVLEKLNQTQNRMAKTLPKKEYENFNQCLNYLNENILRKKVSDIKKSYSKEMRPSSISNHSKISDSNQAIMQRLRKFDETNQDAEFRARLQALSQGKMKKGYTRSSSIAHRSAKRISTTWGRQDSSNSSNGAKDPMKKSEGSLNIPKPTTNGPRKSLFMFGNIQAIEDFIANYTPERPNLEQKKQCFKPFYIYVIIKDNLRTIQIKNVEFMNETEKLKVQMDGYFNYSMIFHKFPPLILETEIKNFMLAHVKLKQKLIWNVLHPVFKNISQYEVTNKNVVSELLCENQKFKFFGFVKKFNAFFFTKYESVNQKSTEGTLAIYNSNLEEYLESIKVSNWNKNESLYYNSSEGGQSSDTPIDDKGITVSDWNIRLRSQQKTSKYLNKERKIRQKFNRKPNPNNKVFHVVKKQQKFVVITQIQNEKKRVFSNLVAQPKYCNLFLVENKKLGTKECKSDRQTIEKFVSRVHRKTQVVTLSILNRKTNNLSQVKIRYEFTFMKKIKKLGFVTCRIFLFKPEQAELILAEAYVQQNQKYYTFMLKPSIFSEYLNLDFAHSTNDSIRDCFVCLVKLIKIRKGDGSRKGSGELNLIFQIGNVVVQGQQLISRVCTINKNNNPTVIDQFTLKDSTSSSVPNSLEIQRLSYKISKDLRNQIVETYCISNPQVLKKYGKYNQFIKEVKLELQQSEQTRSLFGANKQSHYYFPCRSSLSTNYVTKVHADKKSIKFTKFYRNCQDRQKFQIDLNDTSQDSVWKIMLRKLREVDSKCTMKYLGRLMRDPLMNRVLSQVCTSKRQ